MHAHVLLLLQTPILHSYVTEKKKRQEGKKEKERKNGRPNKKEKKAAVRTFVFVVFARSVPCRARFIVALRRVARPPGASSLLSVSRIIISRQQQPQQH